MPTAPTGAPGGSAADNLPIVCDSCATENPPGFAFCGRCGSSLKGDSQPSAAAMPVAAPPAAAPVAPPPVMAAPAAPAPAAGPGPGSAKTMFMDSAPPIPAPLPTTYTGKLIQLSEDGTEQEVLDIVSGGTTIGRSLGGIFASDPYLDPEHLEFHANEEGVCLTRDSSVNGVFVRLYGTRELADGDNFRIGQELMLYNDLPEPQSVADGSEIMGSPNAGFWGRVTLLIEPDMGVRAWPIMDSGISMGREQGEILFPTDGYVSGSHCRIIGDDSGVYLEDLDSSNGTYFRARESEQIPYGSLILLGQHLFRIDPG